MGKNAIKPVLTISLLISNRPDTIPRCLDSLEQIREAIPSELILVDTSKDSTIHSMLLEYTDLVYEFEWCKDFAKARNVGLQKARGEWLLFLDDDEWFEDAEEIIRFFKSGEYKKYGCANYRIRNFTNAAYTRYSDGWATRLYKIGPDSAFHSKIHEYLAPIKGEKKLLEAMVYHSGYIFATDEELKAHFERNSSLLYEMIEEEPESMRWKMQLIKEYIVMKEWEKTETYSKQCIDEINEGRLKGDNGSLCCFWAGYICALSMQKKYKEALHVAKTIQKDSRCLEVLQWQINYWMMECYFSMEKWDKAIQYAKQFIAIAEDSQKVEVAKSYQNVILLLGEVFEDSRIYRAYLYLIVAGLALGSIEALNVHYDKLEWDRIDIIASSKMGFHILNLIEEIEYTPVFKQFLTDACRIPAFQKHIINEAESRQKKSSYGKILYAFAQADVSATYVLTAKVQMEEVLGNTENISLKVQECFEKTEDALNLSKELKSITDKYQIDVYSYWHIVGADQWKNSVYSFFKDTDYEQIEVIKKQIENVFAQTSWKRLFFEMCLAKYYKEQTQSRDSMEDYVCAVFKYYERYLKTEDEITIFNYRKLIENKQNVRTKLLVIEENEDYTILEELFYKYMMGTMEYYSVIYKEEAFGGDMEILPPEARAAVWLNVFFGKEVSDWEGKISALRECARACPSLGVRIKDFVKLLAEEREKYLEGNAQSANLELLQMIGVMKIKIRQMAKEGLLQEALAVLAQVRQLAGDDVSLMNLEQELKGLEE